jgi:ANTAR domain
MFLDDLDGPDWALNSRVVIEQAKGVLFERLKLDMHDAFGTLRSYARRTNRRLSDVARDVIDDRLPPDCCPPTEAGRLNSPSRVPRDTGNVVVAPVQGT